MKNIYVVEVLTERKAFKNVDISFNQTYWLNYSINLNDVLTETKESFKGQKFDMITLTLYQQDIFGRREILQSFRVIPKVFDGVYSILSRWNSVNKSYNIDNPESTFKSPKAMQEKIIEVIFELISEGLNHIKRETNNN